MVTHYSIFNRLSIIYNGNQLKSIFLTLSSLLLFSSAYAQEIPLLESYPNAPAVLYLDFDGETIDPNAGWPVTTAEPANVSNEWIEEIFYIISEDYAPFNLNVTTDRSVYEAAANTSRQMVIFNTTYPSGPGVAYRNSFNRASDSPCWVKVGVFPVVTPVKAANVGSHEAGHTLGLSHDGSPAGEYYSGHNEYRAIMGTVSNGYSQWSKGEYQNASNSEDDLSILSGNTNNFGYRTDDHGDNINGSTPMSVQNDGTILEDDNNGIIGQTSDLDLFKIEVESGEINLTVRPANKYDYSQNLDVEIRLLNSSGEEITSANGSSFDESNITETVTRGTYYLEINGVGTGDPITGYSDYGSLGQFFISGYVTPIITGITDINEIDAVKVYPNPATDVVTIQHNLGETDYSLFNAQGALVTNGVAKSTEEIDISTFQKGVYMMMLSTNDDILTTKIVIK